MTEEQAAMTPAQRMTKGLCPECAMPMEGVAIAVHSITHWPAFITPDGRNKEAIARQKMLAQYAAAQEAK